MKKIGTKSIFVVILYFILTFLVLWAKKLRWERLANLSPETYFCIGLFSLAAGAWLFRFLSLGSPSKSYFRISSRGAQFEGEEVFLEIKNYLLLIGYDQRFKPLDLKPVWMRLLSISICLLVAVLCFDSRTVDLMFETPRRIANAGSRFCLAEKPPAQQALERKPGCELIYRAFSLGYVKSLGSCAPDEKEEKLEVCNLRQWDEPLLHYSSRLLMTHVDKLETELKTPKLRERVALTFQRQLQHSDALIGKLRYVVKSAPKASHHIFTNLPYPEGPVKDFFLKEFHPSACLSEYRHMPHFESYTAADSKSLSRVLNHVYGQLLFNPRYSTSAGSCKEYEVHWNSPTDSCAQLSRDPIKFLKKLGILGDLLTVSNRMKEILDFKKLQYQLDFLPTLGTPHPLPPPADHVATTKFKAEIAPETIMSFQCFMKVDGAPTNEVQHYPAKILGYPFILKDLRFSTATEPQKVPVLLYKELAKLMAEDFHYVGYLSHETNGRLFVSEIGPAEFSQSAYPFTHLEYLKGLDIFMGHEWLLDRADLLEIYPYYYHLYNYVELFRNQYRLQRTRL